MRSAPSPARARLLLAATCLALLAPAAIGCGANHIQPYTPRHRNYEMGAYAQKDPGTKPQNGSLFSEANSGYFEDPRAGRVGDIVSVKIDESADATGATGTNLSKESSSNAGVGAFLGLIPALKKAYPNLDPSKLFEYASKSSFAGQGGTSRKGVLTGVIAVRVVKEMPNGDLYLEGTKVILINNEEYHLYVSGLVRPSDIQQDNSVSSSRIADAQIEFTGTGDLADQTHRGWLTKFFEFINPF
jgi:flagellar L-ring protein precursor FlgH